MRPDKVQIDLSGCYRVEGTNLSSRQEVDIVKYDWYFFERC